MRSDVSSMNKKDISITLVSGKYIQEIHSMVPDPKTVFDLIQEKQIAVLEAKLSNNAEETKKKYIELLQVVYDNLTHIQERNVWLENLENNKEKLGEEEYLYWKKKFTPVKKVKVIKVIKMDLKLTPIEEVLSTITHKFEDITSKEFYNHVTKNAVVDYIKYSVEQTDMRTRVDKVKNYI